MDATTKKEGRMTTAKTLHEKLVEVALEVRNIEKGGRNVSQKYAFVQEADVVRAVWPELLKRGILFYPVERVLAPITEFTTSKGSTAFLTTVSSEWEASDGAEKIRIASMGQGTDTGGDKGVYKALTGDKKYAVLQLLGIATGDDPEVSRSDEEVESAPAKSGLSTKQMNMLMAEAKKAGFDVDDAQGKASLGKSIFEWTSKNNPQFMTNADLDKVLVALKELQPVIAATGGGTVVTA